MTSPAPIHASGRTGDVATIGGRTSGSRRLRLLASGDGWSLVEPSGRLVYAALGVSGRRRCLKFAHDQGVVVVA
jgi:hypothetical protein